jgi:hypothetical protein
MTPWLKFLTISPIVLLLILPVTTPAQIGAYGTFTAATQYHITSTTSSSWTFGPTLGLFAEIPLPFISIGGDLRGQYITGDNLHHWNAVIGPRLEIKPRGFRPYAEFLVGFGGYKDSLYTTSYTTHVDYAVLGGIDKPLIPLIDWRVIEFAYNSYFNNHNTPGSKQFSSGVVLRF